MSTTLHPGDPFAEWPLDQVAFVEEQLLSLRLVHLGGCKFGRLDEAQAREIAEDIPECWSWYSTHLAAATGRLDEAAVPWSKGHPSHRVLSLHVVSDEGS